MTLPSPDFDPRYLEGIRRFNAGDYFDAHEVWEGLWRDCEASDRRFYQSLIHAAVSIYHGKRGNAAGARRLLESGSRYSAAYPNPYRGLDHGDLWISVRLYVASLAGAAAAPVPRAVLAAAEP